MKDLIESKAFCTGVSVGIELHQQKVVVASKQREPLKIGEELYYVQNGKERLREMIDKACT